MSGIFFFIWLILLAAFIVYWRKKVKAKKQIAEVPEVYAKISRTKRFIGIACIVFFVLGLATADPNGHQGPAASPEQQASDMQNFYGQFCDYDAEIKDAWDNGWSATINGMTDGQVDRYTAYSNMKSLHEYFEKQRIDAGSRMPVPESITGEAKDQLKSAVGDYRSALTARKNAAEKLENILNAGDPKPAELDEVKKEVETAAQFEVQASAKVAAVFKSLGIEMKRSETTKAE